MLPKFGREITLLCLPILLIGGGVWWRNHDGPPEDVWSGKARLLTRVKQLEVSPIDQYRGYNYRIAIDQWAAGQLPPPPAQRAGAFRSYREIEPYQSALYVAYRQGKTWKRTLSVSEAVNKVTDKTLKIPSVKPNIAFLNIESIDSAGQDRGKFTSKYTLRLPTSPPVEEAFLMGQTNAKMRDRDTRMVKGVSTDEILDSHSIFSAPIKVKIETDEGTTANNANQPDWKVTMMTVFPPGQMGQNTLFIDLSLASASHANQTWPVQMFKPRLLDAKGHELGKYLGFGSGVRPSTNGSIEASVQFQVTAKQWKTLPKPLVFQTALSVNGERPEEVNLELGKPNFVLPVKPSHQRFVRDPLPLK